MAKASSEGRGKGRPRNERPDTFEGQLGARIEEARKAKSWSVDQLAHASGLGRSTVIRLEGGTVSTAIGIVLAIANALGLSGEQLLRKVPDWTQKPPPV